MAERPELADRLVDPPHDMGARVRPSVPQLLSWRPAELVAAGSALVATAGTFQNVAGELLATRSHVVATWSGLASDGAAAHTRRRAQEVDELATLVHTAGVALQDAGEAIAAARTALVSALTAGCEAGCTVTASGEVHPPEVRTVPGDSQRAAQFEHDDAARHQAAVAAGLAGQAAAALDRAAAADAACQRALDGLRVGAMSPAPRPIAMGLVAGLWGQLSSPSPASAPAAGTTGAGLSWHDVRHQFAEFGSGLYAGAVAPAELTAGVVQFNQNTPGHWRDLALGLGRDIARPDRFVTALVDWQDVEDGHYARWAGDVLPGAVTAAYTGGTAAATRASTVAADAAEAGTLARLPKTLQRGADLFGHADHDPLRKWGPAEDTHPEEWAAALSEAREAGVELVVGDDGRMAYAPGLRRGSPGQLFLDRASSVGALRHELQHMRDDAAAGWGGMQYWFSDGPRAYLMEQRAYGVEIAYARSIGDDAAVTALEELLAAEKPRYLSGGGS